MSSITTTADLSERIEALRESLSPDASINLRSEEAFKVKAARWSEYKAPQPGAVVNVATESDIEKTVQWATANGVKFVAQSGGHAWASTFKIGEGDIVINLRGIRDITVDLDAGTAVLGAGCLVSEVMVEAQKHKAHITVGTCNSVGAVGAFLGGGLGRLQGLCGLGVDNMISARLVTAEGKCITVSSTENSDLWWGLRGAGHSFGIVASLTVKAHPEINGGLHWMSLLIFTPDKIEAVAEAINGLDWDQGIAIHVFFMAAPPGMKPAVTVSLWYPGPEEPARKAYSALLAAGAVFEQSEMTPYERTNDGADGFCAKGGFKAAWSRALKRLDPAALKEAWNLYFDFITKHPQAGMTAVMFEGHSMKKVKEVADGETAFPHREMPFHGLMIPIYTDLAIAPEAEALGAKFRSIMQDSSGLPEGHVYVNFAIGDEKKEDLYGGEERLEKLRALKKKWDVGGCFNQYNPIM